MEATADTVNRTRANIATVAAVRNRLFSGYERAILKMAVRVRLLRRRKRSAFKGRSTLYITTITAATTMIIPPIMKTAGPKTYFETSGLSNDSLGTAQPTRRQQP